MNRRQRKKHRRGEFAEYAFALRFTLPSQWAEAEQLQFWDRAIAQIESLGLAIGGGVGASWDVFVIGLGGRHSVSPARRQALITRLAADPDVTALEAGPLVDAWYGPVELFEAAC